MDASPSRKQSVSKDFLIYCTKEFLLSCMGVSVYQWYLIFGLFLKWPHNYIFICGFISYRLEVGIL